MFVASPILHLCHSTVFVVVVSLPALPILHLFQILCLLLLAAICYGLLLVWELCSASPLTLSWTVIVILFRRLAYFVVICFLHVLVYRYEILVVSFVLLQRPVLAGVEVDLVAEDLGLPYL